MNRGVWVTVGAWCAHCHPGMWHWWKMSLVLWTVKYIRGRRSLFFCLVVVVDQVQATVKMFFSSVITAAALLAAQASAHGAVTSYVIDGKNYPG